MNINELRINNLISHNGLICTVEIINGELNEIYFLGEDFYHSDKPENLEGVPLTEEVLLEFGFSKNENDVLQIETTLMPLSITLSDNYPDEKYKAWVYEDENFSYHIISDNIKYVHTLQNLYFALKGKELASIKAN